jgi:REP-associated tyrosine transposase
LVNSVFLLVVAAPATTLSNNQTVTFYRRNLPHLQHDYKPHFITFCTKHRRVLPERARTVVLESCVYGHGNKYTLHVAVVMPDHAHLILTPLLDESRQMMIPLHEITGGIKSFSAHAINRKLGLDGTVWQEESFDHLLSSSESLDAKIAYVLANPVQKGLVGDAERVQVDMEEGG